MKKYLLMMFAMLTLCVGFSACGSDDDDDEPNVSVKVSIIGSWESKEPPAKLFIYEDGVIDFIYNGIQEGTYQLINNKGNEGTVKVIWKDGSTSKWSYKISGNILTIFYESGKSTQWTRISK